MDYYNATQEVWVISVFNTYSDENKRSVTRGLILIEVGEFFIMSLATSKQSWVPRCLLKLNQYLFPRTNMAINKSTWQISICEPVFAVWFFKKCLGMWHSFTEISVLVRLSRRSLLTGNYTFNCIRQTNAPNLSLFSTKKHNLPHFRVRYVQDTYLSRSNP